jgi:hypothetical protein
MKIEEATLLWNAEGWTIVLGLSEETLNRRYRWNHNEPDMGAAELARLLLDLGLKVTVEEDY